MGGAASAAAEPRHSSHSDSAPLLSEAEAEAHVSVCMRSGGPSAPDNVTAYSSSRAERVSKLDLNCIRQRSGRTSDEIRQITGVWSHSSCKKLHRRLDLAATHLVQPEHARKHSGRTWRVEAAKDLPQHTVGN